MGRHSFAFLVLGAAVAAAGIVHAGKGADLPAGPIRDRHELMEHIGKNAKVIGDAMKAGKLDPVAGAAREIQADAGKVLALFPKGSTHPDSRALDAIWTDWAKFESINKDFEAKAGELAAAASSGGDVGAASKAMFGTCKSCHDAFRKPEEDAKH